MVEQTDWIGKSLCIKFTGTVTADDINHANELFSEDRFFKPKFIINDLLLTTGTDFDKDDIEMKAYYANTAATIWKESVELTEIFITTNPEHADKLWYYYTLMKKINPHWKIAIAGNAEEASDIMRES